jgi:hypothetical protein
MRRPVAQKESRSTVLSVLFALLFRERDRDTTSLAVMGPPPIVARRDTAGVDVAIAAEVDLETPGNPEWELTPYARATVRPWVIVMALVLATGLTYARLGSSFVGEDQPGTCTLPDGSSVIGTCEFLDDFDTLDTDIWNTGTEWVGPLQQVAPELTCATGDAVSIVAGVLNVRMEANARSSCPQTWPTTGGTYSTTGCGGVSCMTNWTPGQPTSYDAGYVDMKTFHGTYGQVYLRAKMSEGSGPQSDASLWGVNCQTNGVISSLNTGLFNGTGDCDWPNDGSHDFDIFNYADNSGNMNSCAYTGATPGSPPLFSSGYYGISYYGMNWSNQVGAVIPNAQTWIAGHPTWDDYTTTYHTYMYDWRPDSIAVYIDGVLIGTTGLVDWIPSQAAFLAIWNITANGVPIVPGDLPSTLYVDWVAWVCPPGVPCTWSGAGAL